MSLEQTQRVLVLEFEITALKRQLAELFDDCVSKQNSIIALRARIETLENENFALAANQCHDGYGDERGNHCCREQDALRARVETLEKALRDALPYVIPVSPVVADQCRAALAGKE